MESEDSIHAELGTAKDNQKSPIHDWYKFTAGFSYKFINKIVDLEGLSAQDLLFDPFAGCGTTLVSAQKLGIKAIGNEGQEFMFDIISAKIDWSCEDEAIKNHLVELQHFTNTRIKFVNILDKAHDLLISLYDHDVLLNLYAIKEALDRDVIEDKYKRFFRLALSQTMHKVSNVAIAVPYIVRSKTMQRIKVDNPAWFVFNKTVLKMANDLKLYKDTNRTSQVYLHDSRTINPKVAAGSANLCITSPPYLNNLDYGETSKVHTHFFGITDDWNDVTEKVRKKLVTGSTTHYKENQFNLSDWCQSEFAICNQNILEEFIKINSALKTAEIERATKRKKSFNILFCLYFSDMHLVLKEIKRVLKNGAKAYIIIGDSAPYGVYIPTTELLAKVALNSGFNKYSITKIRNRGSKWKGLTHRHNIEVAENILIIQ